MAIREHPEKGTILLCDFSLGFVPPEIVKRRPVIVLSPKIKSRPGLCTVVALSSTAPDPVMPYHAQLDINPPLPPHYQSKGIWVKGDMIYSVSWRRLDFLTLPGKKVYFSFILRPEQLKTVQDCVLRGIGLQTLTKYL